VLCLKCSSFKIHPYLKVSSGRKKYVLNIINLSLLIYPARESEVICAIIYSVIHDLSGSAVFFVIIS